MIVGGAVSRVGGSGRVFNVSVGCRVGRRIVMIAVWIVEQTSSFVAGGGRIEQDHEATDGKGNIIKQTG